MKNSILAYSLLTLGILTGSVGIQQIRHSEINTEVIPWYDETKKVPLKLIGTQNLPSIERGRVEVKSVKSGNTALPPLVGSLTLLTAGLVVFKMGTETYKKGFPQYVQDTIDASLAAQRQKEAAEESARIALEDQRLAFQGIAPEPTPQQLQQREHLTALQILQQKQEILAEQLRLAKLEAELEEVKNASIKGKKPDPKKALKKLLKEHEGGWLYDILSGCRPLVLVGSMGSGKTTTANALMMIRKFAFDCEPILLLDTHAHKNKAKNWDLLAKVAPQLRIVGSTDDRQDWDSYLKEFNALPAYFDGVIPDAKDASNLAKTCSFLDEGTHAKTESEKREEGERFKSSFVYIFSDSRKAQHAVTFGLHALTRLSVPEGCYDMIREGAAIVTLRAGLDGLPTLAGTLEYRGNDGEPIVLDITIPPFVNPEYLLEMFKA